MPIFSRKVIAGVLIGAVYGLAVRFGVGHSNVHPFINTISAAFLFICPFSVGAVAVLWGAEPRKRIGFDRQVALAVSAMGLFLLAMFVTLLEGLICIVLVVPIFLIASILGGLVGGVIHNHDRVDRSTLPVLVLLPLLAGPIENLLPEQRSTQTVSNMIHIDAPPATVFDQLADVRDIKPNELGFSFVHLIGLPKPLEAQMNDGVRTSRWEKHVWFQEMITESSRPYALRYRFVVPRGAIPREALDEHVEINGEYFELIDGGYTLHATPDGGTDLSLTTNFVNKSRLQTYGNLWGKLVLKDFHGSILGLMKSRAEKG